VFGLHVTSGLPAGRLGYRGGQAMASAPKSFQFRSAGPWPTADGQTSLATRKWQPRVRFARREAPPRTTGLPPTAERLALAERVHFAHAGTSRSVVIHLRAEAAAVNAIARGSQHKAMSAISNRIARSASVSAPISSAT